MSRSTRDAPARHARPASPAASATLVAVDDVSFDITENEFFALLGPSGCGKTTLLRIIAGLEQPDAGTITLDGADLLAMPVHRRPVNLMFQSYALFPHLTVAKNVAYGLERERRPTAGDPPARRRGARRRRPHAAGVAPPGAAVGRSAPARRPGPGDRQAAQAAAPRRTARRPRPQDPRPDADRTQAAAARRRDHVRRRHPRPGRGDVDGRPGRRDERRARRAAGVADRALRTPGEPVRRRLHRLDEPARRSRHRRRNRCWRRATCVAADVAGRDGRIDRVGVVASGADPLRRRRRSSRE